MKLNLGCGNRIQNAIRRHSNKLLDIEMVNYAVTYRCNSRCTMCNIWKRRETERELTTREISDLFADDLLDKIKAIQVTGGEAFLRPDLPEVLDAIGHSELKLLISTNGFLREIPDICDKIDRDVRIAISIDGMGKMHDQIRGINGAFDKATATAKELIKRGYDVTIGPTVSGPNDSHILKVKEYAESIGAEFGMQVANIMPGFIGNCEKTFSHNMKELNEAIGILKEGRNPQEKLFYDSCISYLREPEKRHICYSGYNSFYLDPYGSVFRCVTDGRSFGNIREDSLSTIWNSKQAWEVRKSQCPNCILGCEFGNTAQYSPMLLKYKVGI